ncbi:MAG: PQQ-binding-like beta-propeller repeat protein, partial [Pseudomonadota bacterium]
MTLLSTTKFIRIAVCFSVMAFAGCTLAAFSPHFPDNRPAELESAMARLGTAETGPVNSLGRPLAFFVTSSTPPRIVAYDLSSNKVLWDVEGAPTSRLVVGRDFLFHRVGENKMVGRQLSTGEKVWEVKLRGGRLLGMATDSQTLYYVTEQAGKRRAGHAAAVLVALKGNSGGTKWVRSSNGRLGSPAARGGLVFVPLHYQSVGILDAKNGTEIARIRSMDEALLWVRATNHGILFGSKS